MSPLLFAAQADDPQRWNLIIIVGFGVILLFALVLTVLFAKYFNLWIQSKTTGANVGLWDLVGMTFRQLGDPAVSGEAGFHEARGATGRVLVACARGRSGKVRVALKGQTVDMLATTDEDEIPAGAEVVIADVRDMVAHVARLREKEVS